jgi:anti-sigma B factor antagonist
MSHRVGDITVLKCSGRIVDGEESAALQEHVDALIPESPSIVLDLGGIDFIDSRGLGVLVRLLSHVRVAGGDLKLCSVPARVTEILKITRLRTIFDSHESEGAAIAAFYARAQTTSAAEHLASDILCVHSSPDVLAYLGELLRQAGYGVMTSTNLPDALMLLKAARPPLVVISAELQAARGTRTVDAFHELAAARPVVELPADFSHLEAGEAAERLLDRVRAHQPPTGRCNIVS